MVDTVTTHWLFNNAHWAVGKFTNLSDATGETNVVKVDATATGPLGWRVLGTLYYPGIHLQMTEIKFSLGSMGLRISWQATVNSDCLILQASDHWIFQHERTGFGGLVPPPGLAGATGSLLFSTLGAAANSSYSIIATFRKNIPNA